MVFILFGFSVYRVTYVIKYLWMFIPLFYLGAIPSFQYIKKIPHSRLFTVLLICLLVYPNIFGITHILTREYGTNVQEYPILMPTHVEYYSVDDKTPSLYVNAHYNEGDVIIIDYWIQGLYLNKTPNFIVMEFTPDSFLKKYPYYKLYYYNGKWKLHRNGYEIISSLNEFMNLINSNPNKKIWYISSADFEGRKHEHISKKEIIDYININYRENIVYNGKDNNSRVYLFEIMP